MAKEVDTTVDQEDEEKDLETDTDHEDTGDDTGAEKSKDKSKDDSDDDDGDTDLSVEDQLAKERSRANKYQRLFQNAQKHSKSSKTEPTEKPKPGSSADEVDERILKSQGMQPELLKQLKDVAKLRGVPLLDAQSDPLFIASKDLYEKKQKQKEASLPAAKGSKQTMTKKSLATPGLSRDEHKAMYQDKISS